MESKVSFYGNHGRLGTITFWIVFLVIPVNVCCGQSLKQVNDELTQWACGWSGDQPAEITQSPTTIRSPTLQHNDTYMLNQECHWRVQAPKGRVIRLTFSTFDLEAIYTCYYAYVDVFDSHDSYEPDIINKFCGREVPDISHTSIHYMYIVFVSGQQGVGTGFEATIDFIKINGLACGPGKPAVLDWSQGGFVSPDWPDDYTTNSYCSWRLDNAWSIRLEFTEWDVRPAEETESGTVCEDSVIVYDGPTTADPVLGTFCGSHAPNPLGHSGKQMLVVFQSLNWYYPHDGKFRAKFSSQNLTEKACGENKPAEIDWSPGNIVGPLSDSSDCSWRLSAPEGKVIRFEIQSFDLPDHCSNCGCSSVSIYNGHGYNGFTDGDLIGEYCGQGWSQEFVQTGGNKATVEYESYDLDGHSGFTVKYFFYDFADHACSTERPINLTDHYGIIASPRYDRGYYPSNSICEWAIHTELGKIVEIHYLTFELQSCPACMCDVLYLYNGEQPLEENLAQEVCDFTNPNKLLWTSLPGAYIRFISDESISEDGFKIEYEFKNLSDLACGKTGPASLNMAPGDILSPNYGRDSYPQFAHCFWQLQTYYEKVIELSFVDFDIEYDIPERCSFDWLAVYDGETTDAPLLGKFCGFELPEPIISTSRMLLIEFRSNYYVEGRGFHLKFIHMGAPDEKGKAHIIAPAVVCSIIGVGALIAVSVILCKRKFLKRIRRQSETPRPPLRLDSLLQNIENRRASQTNRNSQAQVQPQSNDEEPYYAEINQTLAGISRNQSRQFSRDDFSLMLQPPSYYESNQHTQPPHCGLDCPPPTYEESMHHAIAANGQITMPETSFGRNISRAGPEDLNSTHVTDIGSSSRLYERDTTVSISRLEFDTTGYEEAFNDGFVDDDIPNTSQTQNDQIQSSCLNMSRVSSPRRGTLSNSTHELGQALRTHDAQLASRNRTGTAGTTTTDNNTSHEPERVQNQQPSQSKLTQLRHVLQHGASLDDGARNTAGVQMRNKAAMRSPSDIKRLSKSFDNILYSNPKIVGSSRSLEILDKNEPGTSKAEQPASLRRRTKSETNFPASYMIANTVDGEGSSRNRGDKWECSI